MDLRGSKWWEAVCFTRYHFGDKIKEDEMDGLCSTDGRGEKHV